MLYEFKSRSTGSVVMTGVVAERLLAIVGKDAGPKGVFTVEQMGPAIVALQAAIAREQAASPDPQPDPRHADESSDKDDAAHHGVSLRQRAWPLIEMLQVAQKAEQVVTWGV